MEAGNVKAMREALEFADRQLRMATEDNRYGEDLVYLVGCMRTVAAACHAALSAPPRNCDIGTAEEQIKRHKKWCDGNICMFTHSCRVCFAEWAQTPYAEGESDGGK